MSVLGGNPLLITPEGYQISRSVRLRSSASAYLNNATTRTVATIGFTFSMWFKRGSLGSMQVLFDAEDGTGASAKFGIFEFLADDTLRWYHWTTLDADAAKTNGVLRDTSAWYHVVFSKPAGGAGTLYLNGVAQTKQTSYTLDTDIFAVTKFIGLRYDGTRAFDGYIAEVNAIDGQALTASSFGEFDAVTGVWKPKKYAGTYGSKGFYLNFADNSAATAAAIGKDSSGNGNNWTPNNISLTAGVTYDSMIDTPTPYADGGNGRGNYPVINPLDYVTTNGSISNGNLTYTTNTSGSNNYQRASMKFPTSGKWYAEFTATQVNIGSGLGYGLIGVEGSNSFLWWVYSSPFYQIQGTNSTYTTIPTISSGDVVMVAVDMDAGKAWYGQNGTWLLSGNPSNGTAMSNPATFTAGSSNIGIALDGRTGSNTNIINANFGQRPFAYTPPTGFLALNTQNLPDSTIKKGNQYFDATLYTGNGSNQTITNGGFQPDMFWGKSRSALNNHGIVDSVRGGTAALYSNLTNAEGADGIVNSWNTNGVSLGNSATTNTNGQTYVGWQWKKGATQGFDIVTYTGTGANTTVAHGLGVAPRMIIVKRRSAIESWQVYHASLPSAAYCLQLNGTAAQTSAATVWNSTAPTSSVFSVGTDTSTNTSGSTYVAYLFAEVAGFSKFGSYTGNASTDGNFVYLGFRPAFVMIKYITAGASDWMIFDSKRDAYNVEQNYLRANLSNAEASKPWIDFLSNGFKIRNTDTTTASINFTASGDFIFAAFAETPFKYALAR